MTNEIGFRVQGSAPEPYKVVFKKDGNNLTGRCSCPAGINGMYCKHRFNILNGCTDAVVSENVKEVKVVASWLSGSDVEKAIMMVKKAEQAFIDAKKELSNCKKGLARAMRD